METYRDIGQFNIATEFRYRCVFGVLDDEILAPSYSDETCHRSLCMCCVYYMVYV